MANEIQGTAKNAQRLLSLDRDRVERASDQQATKTRNTTDTSSREDRVTLTDTALKLRELSRRLAREPVVDTARIDGIRQALAEGTYEINAERIAGNLLAQEKSLSDD